MAESGGKAPQEPERVINEQYEPIQGKDRAIIKNFGGDNQGIMNYLHKENPNSEFKMEDGSVLGRDRGSKDWRKMDVSPTLDPRTWELQDISDITTDVGAGIAETAASVAGGLAGSAVAPVAGTLGGAMVAAGATSTGIEALKQGIAKSLGTREEIDGGDIVNQGAISALSVPLLGIGGGGKLVKKVADMGLEGVERKAAQRLAQRMEEGLIASGIRKGASGAKGLGQSIASMTSGVKKKDFQTYFNNFEQLESMTDVDAIGMADDLFSQLENGVQGSKLEVSDLYNSLKQEGKNIDISDTVSSFAKRKSEIMEDIGKRYKKNPTIQKELMEELNMIESEVFGDLVQRGTGDLDIENVMNMEKMVKDFYTDPKRAKGVKETAKANYVNKLIKDVSESFTNNIDNSLKNSLDSTSYSQVKKKWKDAVELEDTVKKIVKDPATMYGNLLGIDTKAGIKKYKIEQLKEITENFGIPYEESARKLRAYTYLKNPEWMPLSGTATSTSRSLIGGGVGGTLGFLMGGNPATAAAGAAIGSAAGSPAAMKGIGRAGRSTGQAGDLLLRNSTPWMRVLERTNRD
jgi:hypothetical protein